jgi:carbamoyltransferase
MNILGISCYYHDSAAALLMNGKIISAVQEERFNRIKNTPDFPINSINYCLKQGNITINDIDYICFHEKPYLKFQRVIINHLRKYPFSFLKFLKEIPVWFDKKLILPLVLKERLGYDGKIIFVNHHESHAASSYFISGFDNSVIVTADGVGEWTTTTIGIGNKNKIALKKELLYPNSLGILYSSITSFLGFRANYDEGKVMGLADYGKPNFKSEFDKIIKINTDGSFKLNMQYFSFERKYNDYSKKFNKLFGPPRKKLDKFTKRDLDLAATLQYVIEDIILKICNFAYSTYNSKNLCLAGGLFLNCSLNSKILKNTKFKKIFIQPNAGDGGCALGAILFTYKQLLSGKKDISLNTPYLGPEFSNKKIKLFLDNRKINYNYYSDNKLCKLVAEKIHKSKIICWFQGKMEWGPRALGNRSILANPKDKKIKEILNKIIKKREDFRPFGISILEDKVNTFFVDDFSKVKNEYMMFTGKVRKKYWKDVIAGLHINKTTRFQTVTKKTNKLFYNLIKEFENISKVPFLINTSFNVREPIVCYVEDAYKSFINSNSDYLVMGNYIIKKES